ncbi:hypothetical protein N7456_001566 [Penicillium angulare]|uniref:Zn(2)-C6 fungal-type domain-containing protein n=1 Tax=Penicillium angulare TaxID=116970 RepID=A0A9W9G7X0_9EURO|nr:hypothetical protein N7456_001566 [Penicillium angulare]
MSNPGVENTTAACGNGSTLGSLGSEPKRHAACDECRKRKLKCSGDIGGCARCLKQSIPCHYSIQKTMGRPPKKRARADEEEPTTQYSDGTWQGQEDIQSNTLNMPGDPPVLSDAHLLCPQLFWRSQHRSLSPQPDLLVDDQDHNHSWRPDRLKNPNLPVFPSSSPWPDFSTVSESSAMPFAPPTNLFDMSSLPLTPQSLCSDATPPQCTCLSYLYLCLSHISSLGSFPVNNHTLCSLYIAARTAQDIIRCESCPRNFASGIQNVMFTGTLLTVVADAWLRVFHSDPVELGMQSAPQDYISNVLQSANQAQQWNKWLHQIVRRAVIGGSVDLNSMAKCSDQPALLALINEVENRQRRWHDPGNHPLQNNNPFGPIATPDEGHDHNENERLCMRVVGSARAVIAKFNFDPHEYPEGFAPVETRPETAQIDTRA